MAEPADKDATPESMAQTTPAVTDMMREADTRSMVHELGISVGSLTETVRLMNARADSDSRKLDDLARDNRDIIDRLKAIEPKIDDVLGFIKHGMPNVAMKADLGDLKTEISHRPTRRQAVEDLLKVAALVSFLLGVIGYFSRAH